MRIPATPTTAAIGVAILVGMMGKLYFDSKSRERASQQAAERKVAWAAVREDGETLKKEISAARRTCLAPIEGALKTLPKDLTTLTHAPPTLDAAALKVPFVSPGTVAKLPVPSSVFGGNACAFPVPPELSSYELKSEDPAAVSEIIAAARVQLATLVTPRVVGVSASRCTREAGCVGVLVWVSLEQQPGVMLGVVRATTPMEHLGYDEDQAKLSSVLAAAMPG